MYVGNSKSNILSTRRLSRDIKSPYSSIYISVKKLVEERLLIFKKRPHNPRCYSLTKKGEKIWQKIKELEEELERKN